jgi:hypothetical protein
MCDYSLNHLQSRPARVGDSLVLSEFRGTNTRGFAAADTLSMVVCLRPGTEVAFDDDVVVDGPLLPALWRRKMQSRTARFRQMNLDDPLMHHDALEFADGKVVLLTRLRAGQHATVLQLPAAAMFPFDRTIEDCAEDAAALTTLT